MSKKIHTQQEHGNQSRPDLDFDGIGRGADKGLDFEILLQGLEKQFDLCQRSL